MGLRGRYGSPAGDGGYWPDGNKSESLWVHLAMKATDELHEMSVGQLARTRQVATRWAEQMTIDRDRPIVMRLVELAASRLAELESRPDS